jgi:hypothetical protein
MAILLSKALRPHTKPTPTSKRYHTNPNSSRSLMIRDTQTRGSKHHRFKAPKADRLDHSAQDPQGSQTNFLPETTHHLKVGSSLSGLAAEAFPLAPQPVFHNVPPSVLLQFRIGRTFIQVRSLPLNPMLSHMAISLRLCLNLHGQVCHRRRTTPMLRLWMT